MMDAVNDPAVEMVTVMSSAQVGKTEVINNIIGYFIEHDAAPMLNLQPTLDMAMTWSKDRLAPMVRDTPSLVGKIREPRSKDSSNTILHKTFPGGHITIAGANSPASLASRPVRIVLMDEVDRFPPSAGTEGDPVALARKRAQTFWNRKVIHVSTPTIKHVSRIEQLFGESDQRRFHVPCPKCGAFQVLQWGQVKWEHKGDDHDLGSVRYECAHCNAALHEPDKLAMIRSGKWIADKPQVKGHAGFHINELYSPWSRWDQVVANFLEAKKRPETLRVWVNTSLGETWVDDDAYTVSDEKLRARVEEYTDVPAGAVVLTAGVDVQDDRLVVKVKGWGLNDESWLVDFRVFYGSPAKQELWTMLDAHLLKQWRHESGVMLRIAAACIDSGGHFTDQVYSFVKRRQIRRVFAIKGMGGSGRPLVSKPYKTKRHNVNLFLIGVDTAKELVFARLAIEDFGPGYMHTNKLADDDYWKQLTAERVVTKFVRGFQQRVWVKIRARNEALDCEVYALAAFTLLNANMERLVQLMKEKAETIQGGTDGPTETATTTTAVNATTTTTAVSRQRRRGPGFVRNY